MNAVRPRKLLFFVTEDWYFVSHRLPLALAAKAAGYEVSVVTRSRENSATIRAAGLRLIPFENSRNGLNPLRELSTLIRLILLYRCERPDVAHHVAIKPVLYGSIAARVARTPHVINALAGMGWLSVSAAGPVGRLLKLLVHWVLGRLLSSGIALVQNADDARFLLQLGVPELRTRRIAGSGVDLQQFVPRPEPDGAPMIVFPARLLWDKGVGVYVAAARLLKRRGVTAHFVLAGEPDRSNSSSVAPGQIMEWVEEGVVQHLGWVKDMPRLLARSSIVCLPSFYGEGIPKSLIEAAAAGRPIVTCDTPGCCEVVHHNDNGLLVPPRDPEALADALAQLIADPKLRQRMGARGRVRAEQEFGLESVIKQTLALYAEGPS
jgi:glycosyltransferase involved in cell wall biosynthesis